MTFPRKVNLYEVGPRDGLQNSRFVLDTNEKVENMFRKLEVENLIKNCNISNTIT